MLIPALFVATSVLSLRRSGANPFDLIIFAEPSDVDDTHRQWMEERGIQLCDDLDMKPLRGVARIGGRLSEAVMIRLAIAQHLAGRYDKLLYLDADLTIHDDVSALFALDTGEFPLAAVLSGRPWSYHKDADRRVAEEHFGALGMTQPYRYFNAGVLYIDIEKWNAADITGRVLSFIRQNSELCYLADEDGLNAVVDGHLSELSPIWNVRPIVGWRKALLDILNPVLVHHVNDDKPWRRFGPRKRLFPDLSAYRMYRSFLADTPWPNWLREQWDRRDLWRSCAWEMRRLSKTLRGKSDEPTLAQRLAFLESLKRFCETERFADVEQGIAVRSSGILQLSDGQRPR